MKKFKTESKKILDLMVNSIYANHEVFLRELISNASDAYDKLQLSNPCPNETSNNLPIHIDFDANTRTLSVSDNGIGMDKDELEENLGVIAHSNSLAVKNALETAPESPHVDIIGQFGVGFYSAFMVADHVAVTSRAQGSSQAYCWESDGVEGYRVVPATRETCGTTVALHIRPSDEQYNFERFLDQESLIKLVRKYSNYIRYPITMDLAHQEYDEAGVLIRDTSKISRQVVNTMTPLWTREPAEISQEEIDTLYRTEFSDPLAPLTSMQVHMHGVIDYNAMLFIPQQAPEGLFSKDYPYGLKLYSSGVLIDNANASILPSHFRFVQGVVDTNNLDLNVSREAIQDDSRIHIIFRQIEQRILDKLRELIEVDRATYEAFFCEYGTGLKFAICESQGSLSNMLAGLLLYHSAQHGHLITLQEYLDEAGTSSKDAQILYAVGSNIDRLAQSPAVCALLDQGHDVLLCPNGAQDEICFMLMGAFKGAPFHSVASANLEVASSQNNNVSDTAVQDVLAAIHHSLSDAVARVHVSSFLTKETDAASRISTEGMMTISMARFVASKLDEQEVPKPLYVLEINPKSALFAVAKDAHATHKNDVCEACARVLLNQALLAEDIPLHDPLGFNQDINRIVAECMQKKS